MSTSKSLVKHRRHKLWRQLLRHMKECEQCKNYMGLPIDVVKHLLCWQAQQYIKQEQLDAKD